MTYKELSQHDMTQVERYRIGQVLTLLTRNATLGSSTQLDPYETVIIAGVIRDWLWEISEQTD